MNQPAETESQPAGRLKLIESAIRLFGRDGFDGTSLRELVADAEVSLGLIRFYFGSKEGLRDAAEELVLKRYVDLVAATAKTPSLEAVLEAIDSDTHMADDARFLRRALIEERPIAQSFLQQLLSAQEQVIVSSDFFKEFPEDAWLADPMSVVATRMGHLLLAPQFKTLLGRDVFSTQELKLRNRRTARERDLIRLGLETERRMKGSRTSKSSRE